MKVFLVSSLLVAGLTLSTCFEDGTVNVPEMRIIPKQRGEIKDALPEVYGARPCGGPGQFVQWRVEGCDTTDSPCRFPADENLRRSEVDFVPSEDIEQLGLRLIISVEGKEPKVIYENPLKNSTVNGGEQYTSSGAAGVSKNLQGKNVTVQYILYRADEGKATEICAEADFELV